MTSALGFKTRVNPYITCEIWNIAQTTTPDNLPTEVFRKYKFENANWVCAVSFVEPPIPAWPEQLLCCLIKFPTTVSSSSELIIVDVWTLFPEIDLFVRGNIASDIWEPYVDKLIGAD